MTDPVGFPRSPAALLTALIVGFCIASASLPPSATGQEAAVSEGTAPKTEEVPAEPITHDQADNADHLKLLVRPLTKEELEEAAARIR